MVFIFCEIFQKIIKHHHVPWEFNSRLLKLNDDADILEELKGRMLNCEHAVFVIG